jgi:hypothetical protein
VADFFVPSTHFEIPLRIPQYLSTYYSLHRRRPNAAPILYLTHPSTRYYSVKMPAAVNGLAKGETFLFTSESVGEGHPDKIA